MDPLSSGQEVIAEEQHVNTSNLDLVSDLAEVAGSENPVQADLGMQT